MLYHVIYHVNIMLYHVFELSGQYSSQPWGISFVREERQHTFSEKTLGLRIKRP